MSILIADRTLCISPKLAVCLGLNEAIFLQQLHYWLERSDNVRAGYKWVYNTIDNWQQQMPFLSATTIRRAIKHLEQQHIIVTDNFNTFKADKTKWYRINYDKLREFVDVPSSSKQTVDQNIHANRQNDDCDLPNGSLAVINTDNAIPESSSKNTTYSDVEDEACVFYRQNGFGPLTPYTRKKIIQWVKVLSIQCVIHAMTIAIDQNVLKWAYVETILRNWQKNNVRTMEDVRKDAQTFTHRKQYPIKVEKRRENVPQWLRNKKTHNNEVLHESKVDDSIDYEAERQKILRKLGRND